jgi:glycerol-3-phosphate acyltransferase PlsY
MILNLLYILAAYLIGSFSSAVVVCKVMGLSDPREGGSNNPGATNVLRLHGKPAAIITLAGDLLKGLIPILIGKMLGVDHGVLASMGLAAFLGHLYPVFFGFEGGKGIATFIGVIFGLAWQVGVTFMVTWVVIAKLFKFSSLAALVGSMVSILAVSFFLPPPYYLIAMIIMVPLIFWRHKANIEKLIAGTESKIGEKAGETKT